jgi:lipoate-protein ligase A
MAVDDALLLSVIEGELPAVRFYTWEPPTLSLGVNQSIHEVDRDECSRRGFGLVRRPTGGRAVLHHHELTYSVIARETDPRVSGGVLESYRKISAALVAGLRHLGANVSLSEPDPALYREMARARRESERDPTSAAELAHGAVCFSAASAYELGVGSKKLVGSAQARRGGAILQHGSILLDVDWDAWVSVFAYASERGKERVRASLPNRMTSLRHELDRIITPDEVQAALIPAFEAQLDIKLVASNLTPEECLKVQDLETKYAGDEWTLKRNS